MLLKKLQRIIPIKVAFGLERKHMFSIKSKERNSERPNICSFTILLAHGNYRRDTHGCIPWQRKVFCLLVFHGCIQCAEKSFLPSGIPWLYSLAEKVFCLLVFLGCIPWQRKVYKGWNKEKLTRAGVRKSLQGLE